MEMWGDPSWGWGLSLIASTTALHSTAVVIMALAAAKVRVRLEARGDPLWKLIAILICLTGVIGLLLAMLHAVESAIWAVAYWWLGAVPSFIEALLYSIDSMSTRGASGLMLPPHWRILGALEAVDGMLLFGVSTAYTFAVMQSYWPMLTTHAHLEKS